MPATKPAEEVKPVYIPWKTFESYIISLKGTTIPHTLDGSVRPNSMAGGVWRQLISALRFLGLIDGENAVSGAMEALVLAHGTDQWQSAVKEHVLTSYDEIVGDLPIENATAAQLNTQFKNASPVEGQMLSKAVRFYIHSLDQCGVKYSSLFKKRESTGVRPRRNATNPRKPKGTPTKPEEPAGTPKGMMEFHVPFGAVDGLIRVPRDIRTNQLPVFKAIVGAVEKLADQNSGVMDNE